MNIAIFGIGALGTLFAAHLAPHHAVTLLGHWPEQLAALAAAPLRIQRRDGSEEPVPMRAVSSVSELLQRGVPDLVLVVVKSYQTAAVADDCRRAIGAATESHQAPLILTLQNGLGNREILAAAVGTENVALGVTVQAASVVAPGVVRHAGTGLTTLARTGLRPEDRRLEATAAAFHAAGLETRIVESADALLWGKLVASAAINPLTALLGVENGALAEPPLHRWLHGAAEEVAQVAAARGIALPYLPEQSAGERALEVCRVTAGNRSSMLQDLDRGRPTEIDAICGAVVEAGRSAGISTPINALYWKRVRAASGLPTPELTELDIDSALAAELDALIKDHGNHRQHR